MKKIAFVTSWFGEDITGGTAAELREITGHLHRADVPVEIFATCLRGLSGGEDYPAGEEISVDGITIRRFKAAVRDADAFNEVNERLMNNQRITPAEEEIFLREIVNSPDMYKYISDNKDEYSAFVYMNYMLGTTYGGISACPEKAVLIPCLRDEAYARMSCFKKLSPTAAGMIFGSQPEAELAARLFGIDSEKTKTAVIGTGIDTDVLPAPAAFRKKYSLWEPFMLYAGRKDKSKNIDTLVKYFSEYVKRHDTDLRLVLMGNGKAELPKELVRTGKIRDLGFIDKQDKFNAMGAAEVLCMPSQNEWSPLVMLESWLCGRPVLVSERCPVARDLVSKANGGLYFSDYFEFEACTDYILANKNIAWIMGDNGKKYTKENFDRSIITAKYKNYLLP